MGLSHLQEARVKVCLWLTFIVKCDLEVAVYEGVIREKPSSKEEARQFSSRISYLSGNVKSRFPIYRSEIHHQVHYFSHLAPICATFKEPMGFGPAPKKRKKSKMRRDYDEEDDDEEQEEEEEPGELFLK
ncbi:hypothetical protein JHK85_025766 [Glycine max]|nr:hypothetical protein JHK85_025766 [Glycine max]KAG5013005.1 hypothetical protein JHK86_025266 [Glycine max]